MAKKMLIDATHEEETRVAVMDGDRLVEFDYESKFRKPLKGSIFLAKVTRVEPSLQAAFVNFGGNRHGFLPFSEIHPDYFRIPIADREALIAEQEEMMRESEERAEQEEVEDQELAEGDEQPQDQIEDQDDDQDEDEDASDHDPNGNVKEDEPEDIDPEEDAKGNKEPEADGEGNGRGNQRRGRNSRRGGRGGRGGGGRGGGRGGQGGGKGRGRNAQHRSRRSTAYEDESPEQRFRFNLRRKYKIQEVIKRGQIMLVQVSKEERGNKGAAVSSYLSLPGRYCVLMPNSPRGGGVSRKIANYKDRAKMRDMMKELNVPKGMSVILRTAGVSRTKAEVKRDLDYLMRLWDNIRELTLQSSAPALVYEEADLIKRAVRDLYTRDVEEIQVAGEDGFKNAKNFMKMMIPSHAKRVQEYKDQDTPLFTRFKAERQIAEIGEMQVTLPSGGYLVINPTEALVSIDVNSGKATKERHIEETALKTNLESAEEIARQLKLRDLGGLVVIDFIDMEVRRNNGKVERKMREALSSDRARVQVGRISSFGLMELSRQRMNPSLTEAQFEICEHCAGTGRVRTADATAIMVLRAIEDEGMKGRASQVIAHVANDVALYILNNKNKNIIDIEKAYNMSVLIRVDETVGASNYRVEISKPSGKAGEESEGEEGQGQEKKPGRRRGRRGGRGRRNNAEPSQSLADDLNEDRDLDESGESKPKRAPRKDSSDHKQAEAKKDIKKDEKPKSRSAKPQTRDVKKDSKKDEKPKKSSPASKKESGKDEKKDQKPEESSSDSDRKPGVSNDDKPKAKAKPKPKQEPGAHETVNATPEKKKKGWWSK